MDDATLTPTHPRWREFLVRLDEVSQCQQTTESSRRILGAMPGIDVERSLAALRELGGHCDCAIRFDLSRTDDELAVTTS